VALDHLWFKPRLSNASAQLPKMDCKWMGWRVTAGRSSHPADLLQPIPIPGRMPQESRVGPDPEPRPPGGDPPPPTRVAAHPPPTRGRRLPARQWGSRLSGPSHLLPGEERPGDRAAVAAAAAVPR
jgi:hypothetical protein